MKKGNSRSSMRRRALIREFYRGNKLFFALNMFCMICTVIVNIVMSVLIKELFDVAAGTQIGPVIRIAYPRDRRHSLRIHDLLRFLFL